MDSRETDLIKWKTNYGLEKSFIVKKVIINWKTWRKWRIAISKNKKPYLKLLWTPSRDICRGLEIYIKSC